MPAFQLLGATCMHQVDGDTLTLTTNFSNILWRDVYVLNAEESM